MAITFNQIPSNLRAPLFYSEVSNQNANTYTEALKSLLIGQTVTAQSAVPVLVQSVAQAVSLFGAGSQLARMVAAYKANADFSQLWVLPLADAGGSVAATGTITLTGTATAAGTIHLYIGGQYVQVGVASGDTPTIIAASIVTAIGLYTDLPVSATNVAGVVTLTAKNKGTLGNTIDIRVNHLSELGSQSLPSGVTVAIVAMASGATDPVFDVTAQAALGDTPFEYYIHPFTDTTNLDNFKTFLAARWLPTKQLYGHAFAAKQDTYANLVTLGTGRNDESHTIVGFYKSPTWAVEVAAAYGAVAAYNFNIDPSRSLQSLTINGVIAPKEQDRLKLSERNTLLQSGIATLMYSGGAVRVERAITTYQKNAFNQPDASYLDVTTRLTLARIVRELNSLVSTKFPRSKLAADGTFIGNLDVVTPNTVKAELLAHYETLVSLGLVQSPDKFLKSLVVELSATDPNRLDVYYAPVLMNNLIVFATKIGFSFR